MKKLLLIWALFISFTYAHAEVKPIALPTDTRLVVFTYDQNNSFEILFRPNSITNIQMGDDEKVIALALGDSVQWKVDKTANGKHLFIKPLFENISTSATLVTNKRTYQLILKSNAMDGKWYQRVTWEYPTINMMAEFDESESELASTDSKMNTSKADLLSPGTSIDSFNFEYEVKGDAPFKPLTVFDNGKFTWLRMPKSLQELPALFLITANNDSEFINYIVKGDYIEIQRLVDKVILKIDKQEIKISKVKKDKRSFFDFSN